MEPPFERTLRALARERRRLDVLLVALLVIGAWLAWALLARVGVHVTSVSGRIEVREPVNVLHSEVTGRLVAMHAQLGLEVAAGDVLYELDDAEAAIRVREAEHKLATVAAQREVLQAALGAANAAKDSGRDVLAAALTEARARVVQARVGVAQAEREVARLAGLASAVPQQELERARATSSMRRAELGAAQALEGRLAAEEERAASDRTTSFERLRQELVRLDAETAEADADRGAAELAREQRRVRAPVSGRLGELPTLRPGDYVQSGQALGTIVPPGELHVVAFFSAERALGWVRPEAPARVRLHAFPWTWFGQVAARVKEVALEPKDGLLRVELTLLEAPAAVVLRHGLSGDVEVEVETTSPLALLLRAAGGRSATTRAPAPPAAPGAEGTR